MLVWLGQVCSGYVRLGRLCLVKSGHVMLGQVRSSLEVLIQVKPS
jgi:hypothetical protein